MILQQYGRLIIHSSLMDFIVLYVLLAISDATAIKVLTMLLALVIIFQL